MDFVVITMGGKNRQMDVWEVPKGLCPIQPFPDHITLYISQYQSDIEWYEKARHLLCSL